LQRLGERFYRALGTKTQGSGLGLSICKKIIELHAGEIQFSRSAHGGLKVELQFPLHIQR
jgi:two-component system sensor histidine kinase QseC